MPAPRILVLDTNVLISAFLKAGSPPARVLEKIILGELQLVVSESVVAEYKSVLKRPKFAKISKLALGILEQILENAFFVPDSLPAWPLKGPDPDDVVFLALAHSQSACLVTGNISDFPPGIRKGVRILSPAEYLFKLES